MDDPATGVGHLDTDRLLARDRRQDPNIGRGQRVGEVVLELGDLGDLRARRQPDLVAGDVRSGDPTDDLCLDAEVSERLDQRPRRLLLAGRIGLGGLAGGARQEARIGHLPAEVGIVGDRTAVAALGGQLGGVDRPSGTVRFRGRFVDRRVGVAEVVFQRRLRISVVWRLAGAAGADDELGGLGLGRQQRLRFVVECAVGGERVRERRLCVAARLRLLRTVTARRRGRTT